MTTTIPSSAMHGLYAEADRRFWAQTHYRPGHKLNPATDAGDAAMVPIYQGILADVERGWRAHHAAASRGPVMHPADLAPVPAPPAGPPAQASVRELAAQVPPGELAALYAEADARFWAQTGYKPGRKLTAESPTDRLMMPIWRDIFRGVVREWTTGTIKWTHAHPAVAQHLADAGNHTDAAIAHVAAAHASPPGEAALHLAAAAGATKAARAATNAASMHQPPMVERSHVQRPAHHVMSFVMNGAGQGELTGDRVVGGPSSVAMQPTPQAPPLTPDDTVGAMQAIAAPEHAPKKSHTSLWIGLGIAGAILAGLGIGKLTSTRRGTPRHRRRAQRALPAAAPSLRRYR